MSFIFAEHTRSDLGKTVVQGIQVYGDTKIELSEAVSLNWPEITRQVVQRYGICKVAIPCPKVCLAFAGNNL